MNLSSRVFQSSCQSDTFPVVVSADALSLSATISVIPPVYRSATLGRPLRWWFVACGATRTRGEVFVRSTQRMESPGPEPSLSSAEYLALRLLNSEICFSDSDCLSS